MDNKITKERLNNHLAYDWMKYIGIVAAIILIWSLIFTMFATRLHAGEDFKICLLGVYRNEGVTAMTTGLRKPPASDPDGESYFGTDILELSAQTYNLSDSAMAQAWSVHLGAGEGDFVIGSVLDIWSLIDQHVVYSLEDLLAGADALTYYDESDTEAFLNATGKRYKKYKGEELLAVIKQVNGQITHYKAQATKLRTHLEEHPELGLRYERGRFNNEMLAYQESIGSSSSMGEMTVEEEKLWALDMTTLVKMQEDFIVKPEYDKESDQPHIERIADFAGGCMAFIDKNDLQFYETISVYNYLIDTYLS